MALLQQYYNNTMDVLQVCRLWVTMGHYGHYGHYRFRGKAPWFADVGKPEANPNGPTLFLCLEINYGVGGWEKKRVEE